MPLKRNSVILADQMIVQRGQFGGREREVLGLVAEGLSNAAIAEALKLSDHTVKRHVANILLKLDLPTRAAAAALIGRDR